VVAVVAPAPAAVARRQPVEGVEMTAQQEQITRPVPVAPAGPPVIAVADLVKTYRMGDVVVRALRSVSFAVRRGELVAIMGPSGSGKSTLMNALGCLDQPTSGSYHIDGIDVSRMSGNELAAIRNQKIGFVFQSFNLLPKLTALENVELPLLYGGVGGRHARAVAALEAVGLGDRLHHKPKELSGGQQQRVAIARALAAQPAIILADEPTGNLDSHSSEEVMAIFQRLNYEQGMTVIFVTHEQDIAEHTRRIIRMRDGLLASDELVLTPRVANPEAFAVRDEEPTTLGSADVRSAPGELDGTATDVEAGWERSSLPPLFGVNEEAVSALPPAASAAPAGGEERRRASAMNVFQTLRVALASLRSNMLRTFLTMLGIIIGVAAVIALLAIGNGATANIQENIVRNGTDLLTISPAQTRQNGVTSGTVSQTLTYEDAQALASLGSDSGIAAVSPERTNNAQVANGRVNTNARVTGVTSDYRTVHDADVAEGRFISAGDVSGVATVVVLGANQATTLFNGADPLGATININGQPYQIIGVMATKGGNGFGSVDDNIYVPLTTSLHRLFGYRSAGIAGQPVSNIAVKASNANTINQASDQITTQLRDLHHIRQGSNDDFTVTNQQDQLATLSSVTNTLTIFLGAIAGISLLVGGIGVKNIMLVSVTERTREIGIRKAIGARRGDILRQFLTEAVVMSMFGGLLGIALGVGVSLAVTATHFVTALVSGSAILLAFSVAVVVGIFFGSYPASRASRLNPIDALRYD
jgi:macrolide transport system ATP-binding/permease protein